MDAKTRIEAAKVRLNNLEKTKVATETQLEAAVKQRNEIIADMAKENVTPENIEGEIAKEEAAALEALEKAEKLMPQV